MTIRLNAFDEGLIMIALHNYKKLYNSKNRQDIMWGKIVFEIKAKHVGTIIGEYFKLKYDFRLEDDQIAMKMKQHFSSSKDINMFQWNDEIRKELISAAIKVRLIEREEI